MAEENENIAQYKVILLGDSGVGKTAIINQYFKKDFIDTHIATIGVDFRFKDIDIGGTVIRLQVWDTAGQERFRAISRNYYRDADAIIVVYSVTEMTSFQGVRTWLSEIDSNHVAERSVENEAPRIVKYLVGNKSDLAGLRTVDEARGRNEAGIYEAKFLETSAKDGTNIDELFAGVARDLNELIPRTSKDSGNVDLDSNSSGKKGCC